MGEQLLKEHENVPNWNMRFTFNNNYPQKMNQKRTEIWKLLDILLSGITDFFFGFLLLNTGFGGCCFDISVLRHIYFFSYLILLSMRMILIHLSEKAQVYLSILQHIIYINE